MAGFSLGGGSHTQGRQGGGQEEGIPPESLFLYAGGSSGGGGRNEEIPYSRGFELWQQQAQRQQHHLYSSAGLLGFSDEGGGMQGGSGGSSSRGTRGSGGAGMSCQDCGNQAKKDCTHLRCRTCCKSRGFPCPTHVKSTWVPASKRRERQQQLAVAATVHPHHHQAQRGGASGSGAGGEPSKRPREISTRLPTTITTTTSGGGMEAANFPAEVSSPAVFRCVRVSPMDEAEDEYAYQTAVSIGGHVFKGLLYDQGPDAHYPPTPRRLHHGESSSTAAAAAITTAAAMASTLPGSVSAAAAASAGLLDPSSLYPTPLSAFMAGTQFFPHHPRP